MWKILHHFQCFWRFHLVYYWLKELFNIEGHRFKEPDVTEYIEDRPGIMNKNMLTYLIVVILDREGGNLTGLFSSSLRIRIKYYFLKLHIA
jgi:hypothetical protein